MSLQLRCLKQSQNAWRVTTESCNVTWVTWIRDDSNLSQLDEFWFQAIGLQSVIYRPETSWEFSSLSKWSLDVIFVRISCVSPVLRVAPLFQVLPAPLTVPTLSTPITDFGEVSSNDPVEISIVLDEFLRFGRHKFVLQNTSQTHPRRLRRKAWVLGPWSLKCEQSYP